MAVKSLSPRKRRQPSGTRSYSRKLQALIQQQRILSNRLAKLMEDMEDEEDHRAIERAKKRDAGKPGISWAEAKKRLGLD